MANINPGPAVTGSANTVLTTQPVNTQANSNPVESNQLRALAIGRNINVNAIGDTPLPVLNSTRWNVQAVIGTASLGAVTTGLFPNAATSVAIGINTSTAGAGTSMVVQQIISGLQAYGGVTVAYRFTVANVTFVGTGQNIYVQCATTAGTAATMDIFVLGYDLS